MSDIFLESMIKNISPPVIGRVSGFIKENILRKTGVLFDGDDTVFKDALSKARVYGEYGVGDSTVWVLRNVSSAVLSVDSDKKWIEKVKLKVRF